MIKYQEQLKKFCYNKYFMDVFDSTIIKCLEEDLKQVAPGNYRLVLQIKNTEDTAHVETHPWDFLYPKFDDPKEASMWFLKWS